MTDIDKLLIIDTHINNLISEVKSMTLEMNRDLEVAKQIAHGRKIAINRKLKQLSQAKAALTVEDYAALQEVQQMQQQYSYKSQSQIEIENEVAQRSA